LLAIVAWKITSKSTGSCLGATSLTGSGLGAPSLTGSGSGSFTEVDTGGGGEVDASSSSGFFLYSIASTACRETKMS
jgi:hypothetical protein